MYLDLALKVIAKFNQLAPDTKILIFQICFIIAETGAIFFVWYITRTDKK